MSSFSTDVNSLGQSGPPCLTPLSIRKPSPVSSLPLASLWPYIFLIVFTSCLAEGTPVGSDGHIIYNIIAVKTWKECTLGKNVINTNTQIGKYCTIGNNVILTNSEIGNGGAIGNNVIVVGSRIRNHVIIRDNSKVINSVIGDNVVIPENSIVVNRHDG
ncbi:translation initiation factor eIF-2B subunit epsilon-like isoform X3 [Ostrinia furnacalis]|uniref:translation initiation factor eIF-2B subunit epsilon-like isoform X3 n=1 Tax=Ostrinia furnacalis TaxID=93504 RepID=UPI00103F7B54|nr:translation initiation factor eIF-2B subunit epsilon-like isoform X3 [Ostrinia furnacalis]